MISRRSIIATGAACVVALVVTVTGARNAAAEELAAGAEGFIRGMAETAILKLTEPNITREERKLRMQSVLDNYFHVPGIGQWVLGRFWRQASAEERKEYLSLFGRLIIESYVDKFSAYSGETLEIVKTNIRNSKDAIVSSTLKRPELNQIVQLEWRVRVNNGVYKIVDIMVEGISMGQTQRSEFASAIKHNGGNIGKFLDELRVRVASVSSGS
jgi:phospholipid transport system substrate-binding protein